MIFFFLKIGFPMTPRPRMVQAAAAMAIRMATMVVPQRPSLIQTKEVTLGH